MELQEFLEAMKTSCSFLETEGYSLRKVATSLNRNFWYEKQTDTEGFRINFGWTQYGNTFHVKGLMAQKRFNIVEQEIQNILDGELIDYYTIYKSPSVDYIPKNIEYSTTENNINFVVNKIDDVNLFGEFINNFYIKTALIFFTGYEKLYTVNSQLKELLGERKIQSLLTSMDNTTILRFYVIAIISENKLVKDFFRETYFPHIEGNLDNEINKIEFDRFKLLQSNLHSNV